MAHQHETTAPRDGSVVADLAAGALAGLIGVWALDRVDWFLYDRESPETRARTQAVRPGGLDPAHVIADAAAKAMGIHLDIDPPQPHPAGLAVHYSIGVAPAALYGVLQERLPAVATGRGALFGLSLFLAQDEALNSLTGLAARPEDYPWQDHARGLVAHVAFGIVTDAVLRALRGR